MKIDKVVVRNFRRLQGCEIEFGETSTLFVGANNSGKTSAMDALSLFLREDDQSKFQTRDVTLYNWKKLNDIGEAWLSDVPDAPPPAAYLPNMIEFLPQLDVWLNVKAEESYQVQDLLTGLDTAGIIKVGVRIVFQPKNIDDLYKNFREAYKHAQSLMTSERRAANPELALYPKSLWDFLDNHSNLRKYFGLRYYKLNSADAADVYELKNDSRPLKKIIRVDKISAQRGFTDPESEELNKFENLSRQFSSYYDRHIAPKGILKEEDYDLTKALVTFNTALEKELANRFKPSVEELRKVNYPGFYNPAIIIKSRINPSQTLSHESSVQFKLDDADADADAAKRPLYLSENYNGLGYQNLISMSFRLIQFRDNWIRKDSPLDMDEDDKAPELIHLVLIEEPEAHLHSQAQQVFIQKACDLLVPDSTEYGTLTTQLVISTHSNHIAHEVDFKNIRYFRRIIDANNHKISEVVNLHNTFGKDSIEEKFVSRIIKATHCNLFFADAIIMVEGDAERLLLPTFIEKLEKPAEIKNSLSTAFIERLEVGGNYAQKFRSLIEKLGIYTLVITDLDSADKATKEKALPKEGAGQVTNNSTLKEWLPAKSDVDELINLPNDLKATALVRVAYPTKTKVKYKDKEENFIPYTFEDALVFSNSVFFGKVGEDLGIIKKIRKEFADSVSIDASHQWLFSEFYEKSRQKGTFAVDLLYAEDFADIVAPEYINEGLLWLQKKLNENAE